MSNLELPSRSLPAVITEAIACVSLNITSIIGNSLVCIAAYRNTNLRSTTNLYIIALAVSDLLCGTVNMTLASATLIIGRWDFGDALCQFQGFFDMFTSTREPEKPLFARKKLKVPVQRVQLPLETFPKLFLWIIFHIGAFICNHDYNIINSRLLITL